MLPLDIWQKNRRLLAIFQVCVMIVPYLRMEAVSGRELFEMQRADMSNDGSSPLSQFGLGANFKAYGFMGVHKTERGGDACTVCRVWAPNAKAVSVVGDFNGWKPGAAPMEKIGGGVWECFLPFLMKQFDPYKFCIEKQRGGRLFKSDPYAFCYDVRGGNESKYCEIAGYPWNDAAWMRRRTAKSRDAQPMNIYEVHPGSWRRAADGSPFSYERLAGELVPYVKDMGYTHVELTPIAEYPYDASCGYQTTGFFAPTSRYGEPRGLMDFVEKCHEAGIGVILDWVPSCFPKDEYGLARFDGTPCYEYADPRKGERKEQGALVFDFGRGEVVSFLISSAVFWLEQYHADGLRVGDAASMLYLDYSRERGEWTPNKNGGNENLEAVAFLQRLNKTVTSLFPGAMMIAEDSSAWPMVSRPSGFGGLGFGYKWNTGWRDDMMHYMSLEPVYRRYNHDNVTFSFFKASSENFILPVSHDVAVRDSLMNRMPGESGQKFAGVRALLCYMTAHPGKKLVFMGTELGQLNAWDCEKELDWPLLDDDRHGKLRDFFKDLNRFYLDTPPLWEADFSRDGFAWIANDDCPRSVIAFRRIGKTGKEVIAVCNFLPELRENYRIGIPYKGVYSEFFSSDRAEYGGSGITNGDDIAASDIAMHGFGQSVGLTLPPLSVLFLKCRRRRARKASGEGAPLPGAR